MVLEKQPPSKKSWDEAGCSVYKILSSCEIRDYPDVEDDCRTCNKYHDKLNSGDLISVDLIRYLPYKDSLNGPFLRLSDFSGWLLARYRGHSCAERVPVKMGLWTFHAYEQIKLKCHPNDTSGRVVRPEVILYPMQKVYCDRKVTSDEGINFYRVQGITPSTWICEKSVNGRLKLIPASQIKTGLFAYTVVGGNVGIRNYPSTNEAAKSGSRIEEDTLVSVDAVYDPDCTSKHGPFLRLADGSGWIFEFKGRERMAREVPIEKGTWNFRVLNRKGIAPRFHPVDNQKDKCGTKNYQENETCSCDRMIIAPSGVKFYRVKGTIGWIFDKRGSRRMLQLTSFSNSPSQPTSWSLGYIRDVAEAANLKEIDCNRQSKVISFRRKKDGTRFNIYYTTRTIGTVVDHPKQGRTQLFRRKCSDNELNDILRKPRQHTGKGYKRKRSMDSDDMCQTSESVYSEEEDTEEVQDKEEESLRDNLMEIEDEMKYLNDKRLKLLKSIDGYTKKRSTTAARADRRRKSRLKSLSKDNPRKKRKRNDTFKPAAALYMCDHCSKAFDSAQSLKSHMKAIGRR